MTQAIADAWDAAAEDYLTHRSAAGVSIVKRWAASLPGQARVLDLGCGSGDPVSRVLIDAGLDVRAIDSSERMVAAFRTSFPDVPVACERVDESRFFDRTHDAVIAIGLMFLLPEDAQALLIEKVSRHLNPGGRFLFSSPKQACEWADIQTGLRSVSLGRGRYRELLDEAGLDLVAEPASDGLHHFDARKR